MTFNDSSVTLDRRQLLLGVFGLQAALLLVVGLGRLGLDVPVVRPILAVVYLTFVPGLLVLVLFELQDRPFARLVVYAMGISFVLVMVVGVVINFLYPLFGIARPLTELPLTITLFGVLTALGVLVARTTGDASLTLPTEHLLTPLPLLLLSLPFLSFYGTAVYHLEGYNQLLLATLILISLLPLLVAVDRINSRIDPKWYPLAIWTMSLAIVYHGKFPPFAGGHQTSVLTLQQGVWIVNKGPILPNTVLFPTYSILADVSIGLEWNLINPFLVSFLPVVLFETFRHYVDDVRAFVTTCIFMFSFPFFTLYPGAGRVATPVIFLAFLGLVKTDEQLSRKKSVALGLAFAGGIGVSHYGTSYVVMFAFVYGIFFLTLFSYIDRISTALFSRLPDQTAVRGPRFGNGGGRTWNTIFRFPFVGVYIVFIIAWYMFTGGGQKFKPLPRKIVHEVQGILYTEFTGSAAKATAKSYGGSTSIALAKVMYMLLGVLMGIGALVLLINRFLYGRRIVDDEYLALGVAFLGVLGGSFLPGGGGFNIARVVMIIFTFTALLAIFGVDALFGMLDQVMDKLPGLDSVGILDGKKALAVVLCVYFLLNAGVVSELVLHDLAPSNTASTERFEESNDPLLRLQVASCRSCSIQTHVWIFNHRNQNVTLYGDHAANGQVDAYRGPITQGTGFPPHKAYTSFKSARGDGNRTYLVLLPHNEDTKGFLHASDYNWVPFSKLTPEIRNADKIYTTRESNIYLTKNEST